MLMMMLKTIARIIMDEDFENNYEDILMISLVVNVKTSGWGVVTLLPSPVVVCKIIFICGEEREGEYVVEAHKG